MSDLEDSVTENKNWSVLGDANCNRVGLFNLNLFNEIGTMNSCDARDECLLLSFFSLCVVFEGVRLNTAVRRVWFFTSILCVWFW